MIAWVEQESFAVSAWIDFGVVPDVGWQQLAIFVLLVPVHDVPVEDAANIMVGLQPGQDAVGDADVVNPVGRIRRWRPDAGVPPDFVAGSAAFCDHIPFAGVKDWAPDVNGAVEFRLRLFGQQHWNVRPDLVDGFAQLAAFLVLLAVRLVKTVDVGLVQPIQFAQPVSSGFQHWDIDFQPAPRQADAVDTRVIQKTYCFGVGHRHRQTAGQQAAIRHEPVEFFVQGAEFRRPELEAKGFG